MAGSITAPVMAGERVDVLDVLRGVAILGMWIVNMTVDVGWWYRIELMPMATHDAWASTLVELFFSGKFFTIFSFLFGVGVFVQIERVRARGTNHVWFFLRRSISLLLIAYLALAATARVSILVDYAVLGLLLLFFVDRTPRTMLKAAALLFLVGTVTASVLPEYRWLEELRVQAAEQGVPLEAAADQARVEEVRASLAREPYVRSATFLHSSERLIRRSVQDHTEWSYYVERLIILSLMLFGLYTARRGAVWDARVRNRLARQATPWLLGLGLFCTLVGWAMIDLGASDRLSAGQRALGQSLRDPVGSSALGLGYAGAIVLWFARASGQRALGVFGAVGRTALSCYLFSRLSESFIVLGWGLSMFGRMMPTLGALVVLVLFPLMVLACSAWMARFRLGPAEWAWRSMTYGRLQPLKKKDAR